MQAFVRGTQAVCSHRSYNNINSSYPIFVAYQQLTRFWPVMSTILFLCGFLSLQFLRCISHGCFRSFHIGAKFTILGILILGFNSNLIQGAIFKTMALDKGSDSFFSWLEPLVEERLEVYAFNVTNPEEVAQGGKPKLVEVGPFVYKVVTTKDTRDNLVFNDDGETLTYQPRKFYYVDREQSVADPDNTMITVPNIPFWTALHNLQADSGFMFAIKAGLIQSNGLGTPFITVSISGLLWGYEDELPCVGGRLRKPEECRGEEVSGGSDDKDGDWGMGYDDDMNWRRKRSVEEDICLECTEKWPENYEKMARPKAEYVNCSCQWGLLRDMNVTLREPVRMYHGISDISKKGWVKEFDGKDTMGWWKEGSQCDKVGGQDRGTFPPNVYKEDSVIELFMGPMCRKIKLFNDGEVDHAGIRALRFVPNNNFLGSHKDNSFLGNRENECFCMEDEGFTCFESGVYDMGPCKKTQTRPYGVPLALSAPHFYQADPIFRDQVEGMRPDKEQHQFYVDIEPELGIPLAIQSRFQLNLVLRSNPEIAAIADFPDQVVVPFLWVQEGYREPSHDMAEAVKRGLALQSPIEKDQEPSVGEYFQEAVDLANRTRWRYFLPEDTDIDQDGNISDLEIKHKFNTYVGEVFKLMDHDKDNSITEEELRSFSFKLINSACEVLT